MDYAWPPRLNFGSQSRGNSGKLDRPAWHE